MYTKKRLTEMIEAQAGRIRTFWEQPFTNLEGLTDDTGEACSEIVAAWCLENWDLFANLQPITRELPYRDPLRDGTRPRRLSLAEEILSRDLYREYHPGTGKKLNVIGEILDYQMPLKNRPADTAGKVDLVAWDGETLRLLQLQTPGNTDSLLRCVLESFTNLRTVDTGKLLSDLGLPADTDVESHPFVFRDGRQQASLEKHPPALTRLIWVSSCRPIRYIP